MMNFKIDDAADDGDPHDEIARLETRLEQLAESLSRCRKFRLAAQVAMAGGGIWFVVAIAGLVAFDAVGFLLAVAGVIGGMVMYGSNSTTTQEIETEVKAAEARRAALIGTLRLRVVSPRTLH